MALTCCDSLLTVRRTLLADPEYVAPGRNWTVGVARILAPGVDGENVRLLASELITNVVEHAGGGVLNLEVAGDPAGVTVMVTDEGGGDSIGDVTRADLDSERGRGLYIVEALADHWGVVLGEGSRMVWFTVAVAGADHAGAEEHQR